MYLRSLSYNFTDSDACCHKVHQQKEFRAFKQSTRKGNKYFEGKNLLMLLISLVIHYIESYFVIFIKCTLCD